VESLCRKPTLIRVASNLFGTSRGAGIAILTLIGGLNLQPTSFWFLDIAHNDLAIH